MLPFLIAGAAAVITATVAYIYSEDDSSRPPQPKSLGSFVVWGAPNAGKTTFIAGLRGVTPESSSTKLTTTSRTIYKHINLNSISGGPFLITEISDMPGTPDRLGDWLKLVKELDHVFYLVNLSKVSEKTYMSVVSSEIKRTLEEIKTSSKSNKRLNIIGSHVDESEWKDVPSAEINNVLQEDDRFRLLYESMKDIAGYIYAANLTNSTSFQQLLQSIANDIQARS